MASKELLIPAERIEKAIVLLRGQKVLLDRDLAELYGVSTKVLNQAVKRNLKRFPEDFMFWLTWEEADHALRSQNVTLKRGQHRKYRPYAFTEQGERAIDVNIAIMRAFVRLRELLATHKDLARKLDELEQKYDAQFRTVFEAIRQLMAPLPDPRRGRFGFRPPQPRRYRAVSSN